MNREHTAECASHKGYWLQNLWWVKRKCDCKPKDQSEVDDGYVCC